MPSARGGAQGRSYVFSAISIFCVNSTARRAQFEAKDKPSVVVGLDTLCSPGQHPSCKGYRQDLLLGSVLEFFADNCEHELLLTVTTGFLYPCVCLAFCRGSSP